MIVVDAEDKAHLLEQQQQQLQDLPPPYQSLHPPQVPPRSHHARPHSAGPFASTSTLASASASGSGSSRAPLHPNVRHAHSAGDLDFNPYDLVQYAEHGGHQQAASYSHPPLPQRHSFHNQHPHHSITHTRPMSPRRHSATQPSPLLMHSPSPAQPLPSPSASGMHPQRRRPDSPVPRPSSAGAPRRGSLLASPIYTQPTAAASMVLPTPLSPEMEAVEQGRRYQEQLLARCAAGDHAPYYSYGPAGIISSVLLFPVGLVCLCLDRERRCARCGERLDGRRLQRARR